jgi:hypothetical protein
MNQRSIVLFLATKGFSARAVHDELVAVLASDAIAYSTVTKYLWHSRLPPIIAGPLVEPQTTVTDDAILDDLQRQPFSSVRKLAKLTCISQSTVQRHLTQRLGFVVKHLRWVLHSRSKSQPCHTDKSIVPGPLFDQTARMAIHCDPRRVMVLPEYGSRADMAST